MKLFRAATALAVAVTPLAATGAAESADVLDEVVVVATRFSSQPASFPIGATVIREADIQNSSATSVPELLSRLAGVHIRQNLLGTTDAPIDLRGFGMTASENTLILVNGVRISENESASAVLSSIPLEAIERIEIMRGSGAVLYGGGATAGTINIVTRSANRQGVSGSVSLGFGAHDTRDFQAGFSVGAGSLGLTLDAMRRETDNYRRGNDSTVENINGELRYAEAGRTVGIRVNGHRTDVELPGARTAQQFRTDPRGTSTPGDYLEMDLRGVSLFAEETFGRLTLAADVGTRSKDIDALFFAAAWPEFRRSSADTSTASLRGLWKGTAFGRDNHLSLGVDWADWDFEARSAGSKAAISSPDRREVSDQRNAALYLQNNLWLRPETRLTVGWRGERVRQSIDVPNSYGSDLGKTRRSDTLHAYELALREDFGRGWAGHVRVGKSFRVANVDENRCWSSPCSLLSPQTSRDGELGVEWRGAASTVKAAVFASRLDNELYFNRLVDGFGANMNLDPTRRRGLELEAGTVFGGGVDASVRYAFTDAQFRRGSVYDGVDVSGKTIPLVPRHRVSLALGWQIDRDTRASLFAVYTGKQRYDNDPANRHRNMPSYTVVDFKLVRQLDIAFEGVELSLGVNNLFNRKYYSYGIVNDPLNPTSFNVYPDWRRSVHVSAKIRF